MDWFYNDISLSMGEYLEQAEVAAAIYSEMRNSNREPGGKRSCLRRYGE